jgi:hypothetical protein
VTTCITGGSLINSLNLHSGDRAVGIDRVSLTTLSVPCRDGLPPSIPYRTEQNRTVGVSSLHATGRLRQALAPGTRAYRRGAHRRRNVVSLRYAAVILCIHQLVPRCGSHCQVGRGAVGCGTAQREHHLHDREAFRSSLDFPKQA